MKKISKIFNRIGEEYKEFFMRYLCTNIGLLLITIYLIVFDVDLDNNLFVFRLLSTFICSNLLIESYFDKKDNKRKIMYLLSVILAVGLALITNKDTAFANNLFAGINIAFVTASLFVITRNVKNVSEYVIKVFYEIFKVELFSLILIFGFGIIYLVIETLIIEGYEVEFYDKILIFIIGLYNIPFTIKAFENNNEEVPVVINTLISKVLLILLDVSYLVMIMYIIKMIAVGTLPSNEIFVIVSLLYAFSIPMFIMLKSFKGKIEIYSARILPYLLIVPLLLQIYSLGLRINTYGVTEIRYAGIYLILFEAITLALHLIKKGKYIKYSSLVLTVIALIVFVIPGVNMYDASMNLQVYRLKNIWTENTSVDDLTKGDRQKIKDIYEFLNEHDNPDRYLPDYLKMEKINKYLMNTRGLFEGEQNRYFSFVSTDYTIDISEFNYLENYNFEVRSVSVDDMKITIDGEDYYIKDEIMELVNSEGDPDKIVFTSNSGKMFVGTELSFYYNERENILEAFYLEGHVLY